MSHSSIGQAAVEDSDASWCGIGMSEIAICAISCGIKEHCVTVKGNAFSPGRRMCRSKRVQSAKSVELMVLHEWRMCTTSMGTVRQASMIILYSDTGTSRCCRWLWPA